MKIQPVLCIALSLQVASLILLVFRGHSVSGQLRTAKAEMETGEADLPALTFYDSNSSRKTLSYDPSKARAENLLARAMARLSLADRAYGPMIRLIMIASILTALMLILALLQPPSRLQLATPPSQPHVGGVSH